MKPPRPLLPKDVTTLVLAREALARSRPIGDDELVERLRESALDPAWARASLARLEDAGQLRFGGSGWERCPDAPPLALVFSHEGR